MPTTAAELFSLLKQYMLDIPAGVIELRDDRTKKSWSVNIHAFQLAKFPVTQDLYFAVTAERPATFKGDQHPVESISWKEAVLFCNQLSNLDGLSPCYLFGEAGEEISFRPDAGGYRLPTEAEWEYACKAGTGGARYAPLDEVAWYRANSEKTTHPVGQKAPNAWGLYDMLGNVWEWCSDVYDENVYGSYRIFRGGGWYDEERSVMATTRRRSHPLHFKIDDLGFRIAKSKT